jgi:drug/metabolite transporter (DMT)-like permease
VLVGFAGVALILRPTIEQDQLWHGLMGLLSGVLAAMAYLQVDALGRAGEPEERTVFYFCVGGLIVGALAMAATGTHPHSAKGIGLLLAIGALASVAQLMMTRAFVVGKVLVNASLQYLGIVYSYAFGMLFFDDRMTWSAILGMALVVGAGVAATLLRSRSRPADNAATPTTS